MFASIVLPGKGLLRLARVEDRRLEAAGAAPADHPDAGVRDLRLLAAGRQAQAVTAPPRARAVDEPSLVVQR
jgi:hypothetical protein